MTHARPDQREVIWEETACPLCAAHCEEALLTVAAEMKQAGYRLVRCRSCGLGYLNPRPVPECVSTFYPDDYECYQPPQPRRKRWFANLRLRMELLVMACYYGNPPPVHGTLDKILGRVCGLWLRPSHATLSAVPYVGEGELLDFGCGSGWFAQRMARWGWKVTAMDFSKHAIDQVQKRYGIPTLIGTLPHQAIKPESFDMITMGQVLEHVHKPHEVIAAAARALRPGGLLVISVPNLESWGFRHFRRDWWPLDLPRHLSHFSPATLRRLVEAHGLQTESLRLLGRTSWMRRSFAFAHRRSHGALRRAGLGIFRNFRFLTSLLTRWTVWTRQSDCLLLIARRPKTASQRQAA
jgi:SAM-dependent methyltransferase